MMFCMMLNIYRNSSLNWRKMEKAIYILLIFFLSSVKLCAHTRAEVASQKWQGVYVDTIIGNAKYPDVNGIPQGFPFILYNVGTGCFITQGGDWAMEGRLFYSDFGRTMYLCNNGRINSGITEENVDISKNSFCVRPPDPFGMNWNNIKNVNFTTLMDGKSKKDENDNTGTFQKWVFERVEDASNDTCTYYMYQQFNTDKKYYFGAVYGEYNGDKGVGDLIFLDDDRSCWTTAPVKGVTTKYQLENGDEVELQKLYQWRLVSIEEFLRELNSDKAGLNPSVSALIPDRDFSRNAIDFFSENPNNGWAICRSANHIYEDGVKKRWPYTWGNYKMGSSVEYNKQRSRGLQNQSWDSPVRLKAVFDTDISQERGKKDAKYGFMEFEGVGYIYSNFQVTKPGWYEITTIAICQSDDNDAYMFARVINDADSLKEESLYPIPATNSTDYGSIDIDRVPLGTYQKGYDNSRNYGYENCLVMGKELLINGEAHQRKVWVLVSEEDFNNSKKTIRVGIRKDNATISDLTNGGYYDLDWVCVDDIHAFYMGMSPAFFYEDMETLDYLDDINHYGTYIQNEYPKRGLAGEYGGAVSIQRKFTNDAWNTFSFILPLTGEQIRNAFGDKTELLELDGIGTISNNENIIDFKTVNLITTDYVIVPGKLYLIKPSKLPVYGESPRKTKAHYYDLGRMFFSVKEESSEYKYPVIDLTQLPYGQTNVGSYQGRNNGTEHVTYIQTPNYANFRVDRYGDVMDKVGAVDNTYCPKGGYIMSGGKMYELSRDTPLKGFRGWITLTHSIFGDSNEMSLGAPFSINGVFDYMEKPIETNIIAVSRFENPSIKNIYDIAGRKIDVSVGSLPKGLYIVQGKKLLIK